MFTYENDGKSIYSVFQPIYSFSNQAYVGAEALIRGKDIQTKTPISVIDCLQPPKNMSRTHFNKVLNRTHLSNWKTKTNGQVWLFLNLDFQMLESIDDLCLKDLLGEFHINGKQLVVEIVEKEIVDEDLFQQLIQKLRSFGCLIALDDFGAGHSNIDRIWRAEPDIVKLDRQILLEATKSRHSESILRNLTNLIKQSGSITLLEGIETKEQALLAMDVGVDLVQGFYFAMPNEDLSKASKGEDLLNEIIACYPDYKYERELVARMFAKGYETLFRHLAELSSIEELERKMLELSKVASVKRFFVLDRNGYQISDEYKIPKQQKVSKAQGIMKKGKGLCWKNRRYFVKAIENPERTYVSKPYRSLIDVELCLTVSKSITLKDGQTIVACYDIFYQDH